MLLKELNRTATNRKLTFPSVFSTVLMKFHQKKNTLKSQFPVKLAVLPGKSSLIVNY